MVRFSCFQTHIHSHKSKKTIIPQAEAMKTSPDYSQNQASKDSSFLTSRFSSLFTRPERDDARVIRSPSRLSSIVSASKLNEEIESLVDQSRPLKKSQSVGSILCQEGREGMDLESSPDGFEDHNKSTVESEHVNKETIFSIDDQASSGKDGNENSCAQSLGECVVDSGNQTPFSQHKLVRSYSVPKNIGASSSPPNSGEYFRHKNLGPRSRSSDDLLMMAYSGGEMKAMMTGKQASNDDICKTEITNVDNGYDVSYSALAFEVRPITNYEVGESSSHKLDELPSNDKFKRIKEWVSDLQPCSPLDEANEPELFTDQGKRDSSYTPSSPTLGKVDGKVNNPDTEAAKKYISSMSGSSTTAQMSNLGLVVIPFLSAFVSLRILNLSGNSIVRITAGSLPRGLHMLNLSKNNISTIEGLRELTRLRILDLRSNRITRIGHGLASCSSLKELYLAGNKISEVEGLHRLLKLSVLDLRFNKISTSKCLGQLAANYNSLQTISLEGNPAQRNVGDEQLKKYLHGLLPHLVDYNCLPVKPSSLKDAATDRSVRSGIGAHQFDRGLRSDHKGTRKSGHSLTTQRPSSSAASSTTHGHRGQSKVRTGRLPPGGPKVTSSDRHRHLDLSKGQEFKSVFSIPKSRSEGALGAF